MLRGVACLGSVRRTRSSTRWCREPRGDHPPDHFPCRRLGVRTVALFSEADQPESALRPERQDVGRDVAYLALVERRARHHRMRRAEQSRLDSSQSMPGRAAIAMKLGMPSGTGPCDRGLTKWQPLHSSPASTPPLAGSAAGWARPGAADRQAREATSNQRMREKPSCREHAAPWQLRRRRARGRWRTGNCHTAVETEAHAAGPWVTGPNA